MNKKLLLSAGAIVATGVMSIGCGLSTATGQWVDAKSTVWVVGKDKIPYRINLELIAPTTYQDEGTTGVNEQRSLVVSIYQCPKGKCGSTTPYVATLGQKTATSKATDPVYDNNDLNNVTAHVVGWGTTLDVTWKGTAPGSPVDGAPAMNGTDVASSTTWKAPATVTFLGVTCTDAAATVTRTTRVSPLGIAYPHGKTVPAGAVPGVPTSGRCSAPLSK